MSSGSYFPPPVKGVEIPKPHGGGVRLLGVPTIADRVAQTVVAMHLEERAEPRFHPDSYGYRPKRSAHDAVDACRKRCWEFDWLIDLDVESGFPPESGHPTCQAQSGEGSPNGTAAPAVLTGVQG